jgi:hypothetical protein
MNRTDMLVTIATIVEMANAMNRKKLFRPIHFPTHGQ